MAFGLASRAGLLDGTALALLEIAWRFQGPVRPGDTVCARIQVADKRSSRKFDRGIIELELNILNQRGELVQSGRAEILIKRREHSAT
jgi:3-hydroxybutyryl-CoA dehydratase